MNKSNLLHMKYLLFFGLLILPTITLAATTSYLPLVNLPGITDPGTNFEKFINTLYATSISLAALLAVIKIIIAGVKWMMTDVVTSKGDAKKDIQAALTGLLVVLAAVLILSVINKNLVSINLSFDTVGTASSNNNTASKPASRDCVEKTPSCIDESTSNRYVCYDCTQAVALCTAAEGTPGNYTDTSTSVSCTY